MFDAEQGAWDIIMPWIDKYEAKFGQTFPTYEYLEVTVGDGYDFSVAGCKELAKLIEQSINDNKPVDLPEDYNERLY
ncbi:hypothetical protein ACOV5J_03020 [Weissella soli]|jgi:hypothetical protein|uniref:hypothetical protein n=1 Tax=Weissella soli TaxID=155866 RepID=UPI003C7539E8